MTMKKIMVPAILLAVSISFLQGASKSPVFSQVIANPGKTLNFNIFIFPLKLRWVESQEGNYTTVPMVLQNDKNAKPLVWEDYKVFVLLKDGKTLFQNYTTAAKEGYYACKYTVAPSQQYVQNICFAKKFQPGDIDRIWLQLTHSNFILLIYNPGQTGTAAPATSPGTASSAAPSPGGGPGIPEARRLLGQFLDEGDHHASMTKKLRPTEADYRAYFTADSWQMAMQAYDQLWDQMPFAIKPNPGQTKLLLWKATTEELKNRTGDAEQFPGGYFNVIHRIKPGHTIFRWKFVKPGKTIGMAFDGLVYINGAWKVFPKPWRALK